MSAILSLTKIISGGQTGVDRAALDWAMAHGIEHGGWCPGGRLAEDGTIDSRYLLSEVPAGSYRQRTRRNVLDTDGTLLFYIDELEGGTLATWRFVQVLGKPHYLFDLCRPKIDAEIGAFTAWLSHNGITVLNIAGPRESKVPGIHGQVLAILDQLC